MPIIRNDPTPFLESKKSMVDHYTASLEDMIALAKIYHQMILRLLIIKHRSLDDTYANSLKEKYLLCQIEREEILRAVTVKVSQECITTLSTLIEEWDEKIQQGQITKKINPSISKHDCFVEADKFLAALSAIFNHPLYFECKEIESAFKTITTTLLRNGYTPEELKKKLEDNRILSSAVLKKPELWNQEIYKSL